MIVVDASVIVELLLMTVDGLRAARRLLREGVTWHAPHLLDLEVTQVLRRLCASGELDPSRAHQALDDLAVLPLIRYRHDLFLPRIWELRHQVSAYDAVYVALAENLRAPLLTRDRRLRSAPGCRAAIEAI